MLVKEVADVLETKGGYLHFELNGHFYFIADFSVSRSGLSLIFKLRRTVDKYNDVGILWENLYYENSNFKDYKLLLSVDGDLYNFPDEITLEDDCYTAWLSPSHKQQMSTSCAILNTISEHAKDFGMNHLDCDCNNAKIVIKINGVTHMLSHGDINFTVNKDEKDGYSVVLDVKTK